MKVSPVSYNMSPAMKAQPATPQKPGANVKNPVAAYPPLAVGAINGACWFAIGYAFDKACKALFKTNTSNKTSLIVNGALGAIMGTYAFFKANKIQKEALNK